MKKLIIALSLGLCIGGLATAQVAQGGTLYVATESAAIKSSTGLFAKTLGALRYGERVTVLQVNSNGKYVEVRSVSNSSLSGWTAAANLSARQVITGSLTSASAQELALAGKGSIVAAMPGNHYWKYVEDDYRTQGNLNYADVEIVEQVTVSETELYQFLEEGRLAREMINEN